MLMSTLCHSDLEDGDPSSDDSSSSSSISDDSSSRDSISDNSSNSSSSSDSCNNDVDKSKKIVNTSKDKDNLENPNKVSKHNLKTRMKEAQEDEEEYLRVDASSKFQFNYNKVTAFSNNYPEIHASDQPLVIAPGEGNI